MQADYPLSGIDAFSSTLKRCDISCANFYN